MEPSPPASPLRGLRLIVLGVAASLLIFVGVLWLLGQEFTRVTTVWIALPFILGVADLVLVPAVGSTVRPLPYGIEVSDARRISAGVLRTVTVLRLVLAAAPALFGLIASLATGSLVPYAIGLAFAGPLLLILAYPSRRAVDAVRTRLESGGMASHLWDGLGTSHR